MVPETGQPDCSAVEGEHGCLTAIEQASARAQIARHNRFRALRRQRRDGSVRTAGTSRRPRGVAITPDEST